MPYYKIEEFIKACKEPKAVKRVRISSSAQEGAKFFKLKTQTEIRSFIANNGLEELVFQNTEKWRDDTNLPKRIVDAYGFRTGLLSGYIAFIKLDKETWYIKSFKENDHTIVAIGNSCCKV